MELLERYLQAVKKHLPSKKQDDIVAELRTNMESQLEDKEAELGRPLTQNELEDWLRTMGPPILVASRYRPQQYLIGPALYPLYLYVLRIALFWVVVIYTVVNGVLIMFSAPHAASLDIASLAEAAMRGPGVLITVAAWVTIFFAAFEFAAARFPEKCPQLPGYAGTWSPNELPPLEKNDSPGRKPRSFAQAVAEVVFGFLVLVWLLLIPSRPFLLLGPGVVILDAGPMRLADAWWTFYWLNVALTAIQLAWRSIDLARGTWQYTLETQHVLFKGFGLVPIVPMLNVRDHAYILLKNPAVSQMQYGAALATINKSIFIGLLAITFMVTLQLAWDIGKLILRASREREVAR